MISSEISLENTEGKENINKQIFNMNFDFLDTNIWALQFN